MTDNEKQQFPEAPASVTLTVMTPKGYPALFSVRDMDWKSLVQEIESLEKDLEERGYTPQVKTYGAPVKPASQAPTAPQNTISNGPRCPIHGAPMAQRQGPYGTFWACPTKNADGSYCKAKPGQPTHNLPAAEDYGY